MITITKHITQIIGNKMDCGHFLRIHFYSMRIGLLKSTHLKCRMENDIGIERKNQSRVNTDTENKHTNNTANIDSMQNQGDNEISFQDLIKHYRLYSVPFCYLRRLVEEI